MHNPFHKHLLSFPPYILVSEMVKKSTSSSSFWIGIWRRKRSIFPRGLPTRREHIRILFFATYKHDIGLGKQIIERRLVLKRDGFFFTWSSDCIKKHLLSFLNPSSGFFGGGVEWQRRILLKLAKFLFLFRKEGVFNASFSSLNVRLFMLFFPLLLTLFSAKKNSIHLQVSFLGREASESWRSLFQYSIRSWTRAS